MVPSLPDAEEGSGGVDEPLFNGTGKSSAEVNNHSV